jgi:hypothetical protein
MRRTSRWGAVMAAVFGFLGGPRTGEGSVLGRGPPLTSILFGDVVSGLSAVIAAVVAFFGIDAWRRRLRGALEYKVAFKTLEALFAVREAIQEARARGPLPLDRLRELPDPNVEDETEVRLAEQSYRERLLEVDEAEAGLLRAQQEALALWGEPAKDSLADAREAVHVLHATSDQFFEAELDRVRRATWRVKAGEPDADTLAMKRILYSIPDAKGKDPFGERVARAVAEAESFYRSRMH